MTTLKELISQLLDVEGMDGELDDETIRDTLDGIEGTLSVKIDAIAGLMSSWSQTEDVIAAEIRRLQNRKRMFGNRRDRLKEYLRYQLSRLNQSTVETDLHTVFLRKGAMRVVVDDLEALPEDYQRVTVEADKSGLKSALKDADIPGAHLERGPDYVVIK